MNKETELKPCPFCGGEAEICSSSDREGKYWYIKCKNCSSRGSGYYESLSALKEYEEFFAIQRAWGNAIKAWNRRVGVIKENGKCNLAEEHWIVYVNKSRWFSPSYYVYCSRCLNGGLHMDAITGEPILEDFCTYCYADMKEKDVEWKILSEQEGE